MNDGDKIKTGAVLDNGLTERQKADEEKTLNPSVLERELFSLADRYSVLEDEDGNILTPTTTIGLGDEDEGTQQEYTVQIGCFQTSRLPQDRYRAVVFQADPTTGDRTEWIIFNGFPEVVISDGTGDVIESIKGRKLIRSVLAAMKEKYASDVAEQADSFDIKAYLIDTLRMNVVAKKAELRSLQQMQSVVEKREEPFSVFRVTIHDAWAKEAGQSVDEDVAASSLSEAVQIAADKFKKINHRNDIQASGFAVSVYVNGQRRVIPEQVTAALCKSLFRESIT